LIEVDGFAISDMGLRENKMYCRSCSYPYWPM